MILRLLCNTKRPHANTKRPHTNTKRPPEALRRARRCSLMLADALSAAQKHACCQMTRKQECWKKDNNECTAVVLDDQGLVYVETKYSNHGVSNGRSFESMMNPDGDSDLLYLTRAWQSNTGTMVVRHGDKSIRIHKNFSLQDIEWQNADSPAFSTSRVEEDLSASIDEIYPLYAMDTDDYSVHVKPPEGIWTENVYWQSNEHHEDYNLCTLDDSALRCTLQPDRKIQVCSEAGTIPGGSNILPGPLFRGYCHVLHNKTRDEKEVSYFCNGSSYEGVPGLENSWANGIRSVGSGGVKKVQCVR